MDQAEAIEALKRMLGEARRAVVFTGAGISTESGIPDFRSPGGIWQQMKPIYFQDFLASVEARRETWKRRFAADATLRAAEPNRGHRAVARLVQPVDVLCYHRGDLPLPHQAGGVPERQVIELHGNTTYATCLDCAERYELDELRAAFERDGDMHDCRACGGLIKTATISFGQQMPEVPMLLAQQAIAECDLCLVLGSSLVVYPAAGFPEAAKRRGARLAIVNREETGLDAIADLVIHRGIGDILGGAVGVN